MAQAGKLKPATKRIQQTTIPTLKSTLKQAKELKLYLEDVYQRQQERREKETTRIMQKTYTPEYLKTFKREQ